jgi:membrane-bound lytic murein transglycosylase A
MAQARWARMTTGAAAVVALCGFAVLTGCAVRPTICPPPSVPPTPQAPPAPHVEYEPARWSDLPGWSADDMKTAWSAFLQSCNALHGRARWVIPCTAAQSAHPATSQDVRAFFERYFEPYAVVKRLGTQVDRSGLMTGYFEPLLHGARSRSAEFDTPLYAPPPDLLTVDLASVYPALKGLRIRARLEGNRVVPYYSRAELGRDSALEGHEIVWVDNALDAFFLEVQGSGRVELPSGEIIRLHYADENGYPYRSIGRYLVEHGDLKPQEATMLGIRLWARLHPDQVQALLDADPSVVFFREEPLGDPALGPKGSLGVPLTPGRSIAVDPTAVPLGAPVFLDTTFPDSAARLERLVVAQDTGGAIRGPVRADLFWGTGAEAAGEAGEMRQQGRMWLIWPKGAPLPITIQP